MAWKEDTRMSLSRSHALRGNAYFSGYADVLLESTMPAGGFSRLRARHFHLSSAFRTCGSKHPKTPLLCVDLRLPCDTRQYRADASL